MELFTERNGMRADIIKTATITAEMYAMIFDCCEKYYDNLAWCYSDECPDGRGCSGLDKEKFNTYIRFKIPTLYRDRYGNASKPSKKYYSYDEDEDFDQYALFDYVEYIGKNCRDFERGDFHSYFGHTHISFLKTNKSVERFRNEINEIFMLTGLLYVLNEDLTVERVIDNSVISSVVVASFSKVDIGTRELLEDAVSLFKQPRPQEHRKAVEKIWDALESLKTHFPGIENKHFDEKLAKQMSNGHADFEKLFKDELSELGKIGNNHKIRHFNQIQTDSEDERHYDYFFNRCLAFVATAIQYLPKGEK